MEKRSGKEREEREWIDSNMAQTTSGMRLQLVSTDGRTNTPKRIRALPRKLNPPNLRETFTAPALANEIGRTACEPLEQAVTFENLAANASTYDYCAAWQPQQMPKCLSCLSIGGQHHFLRNCKSPIYSQKKNLIFSNTFIVLTVLSAACEQQPLPGKAVGIKGDIFSTDIVNATNPTAIPTLSPDYFKEGSFGLGAKVGVALGSLAFLLVLAGFLVVCLGKRKRRAYLRQIESAGSGGGFFSPTPGGSAAANAHKSWAGQLGGSSGASGSGAGNAASAAAARGLFDDTPMSQKPLRGWDDSPLSATTEKGFPKYFSPYSSQFSSPVSASESTPQVPWPPGGSLSPPPQHGQSHGQQTHTIGLALGGDDSSLEIPSPAKGKERATDGFEEEDLYGGGAYGGRAEAPVLQHPGFGRSSESLPRRYRLTAEDARRGDAI